MKKTKKILPINKLDSIYDYFFSELSSFSLPQGCLDLLTYVISELFANVKEHSFSKTFSTEFAINRSVFYFYVSDNGIGMRKSFLRGGIFAKDDRASILLAMGGISTKKRNERAFGLFSIQRLTGHTGGTMSIQTGKSKAIFKKNNTGFEMIKRSMKGVTVTLEIPLKKINVYEILY
jgi:hypothetical protein